VGEDVRQHRRTVRLAGAALASLLVLTLASVVGAAVALDQRNTARDQAALATSRQLAATAQTLEGTRLDRALLLSMEAVRIRDTPEARGALLRALQGSSRLHQMTQFEGALYAVAVSPDGHTLASGGAGMEVHLRDLVQRRPAGEPLRGHTGRVESVAFSPDGRTLASSSADGTIAVWDLASGRPLGDLRAAHGGGVERVTFSPDGSALASAGADGKVAIWDVVTRSPRAVLEGHGTAVRSVAFSPDGQWLVSGDFDGKVVVWDPARHQPVAEVRHDHAVTALAFTPDGALFASASIDGAVKIRALPDAAESGTALMVANGTTSISFSADGNVLAAGTYRGRITLWDVQRRQPLRELGGAHEARVNELAFSPNTPGELVSVAEDGTFALWDTDPARPFGTSLQGDPAWVTSVAFHPDGTRLAAAMATGTSAVWALPEHRHVANLDGHDGAVTSVAFSPDGRILASAGVDGDVRLWDVDAGRMLREPLRRPGAHLTSVAFSPDGKVLAAAGTDGTIVLWDTVGGVPVRTLTGHTGEVTSVAFRPDGQHLASGSADQTIRVWETSSGRPLRELRGHGDAPVLAVTFSPDGELLASGGADRGVVLWDPVRAERKQSFNGHAAEVRTLAFSPDGRLLASGGDDHNVVLWDLPSGRDRKSVV
jgi:WD40 repeat protein